MKFPSLSIEGLKAGFTYSICAYVVVRGLSILYDTRNEPAADDLRLLIGGLLTAVVGFLIAQEVQTRTARQTATATAAGANQAAPPSMTITSAGPPETTTTVTPTAPKPPPDEPAPPEVGRP